MEKISIIVPIYNVEKYLDDCLKSIIEQTYKNLEIILINDGSTDNSLKICYKYKKIDKRIILIDNKNHGVSYSRNKGIDVATGKYIVFIDSDDTIDKNYISELANVNKEDFYDIVMVNFKDVFIENDKKRVEYNNIDVNSLSGKFFNDYYYIKSIVRSPWGKLFKRDIIEKNNIKFPVEISLGEDYVFNMQYYRFVKQYRYVNKYLYNYFHRNRKCLSKGYTIDSFDKQIEIIKKQKEFFKLYNIRNGEIILGDDFLWLYFEYTVLKDSLNYTESKQRLKLLKIETNNPKKTTETKRKDKIILRLINKDIYFPIYLYCLLRYIYHLLK